MKQLTLHSFGKEDHIAMLWATFMDYRKKIKANTLLSSTEKSKKINEAEKEIKATIKKVNQNLF